MKLHIATAKILGAGLLVLVGMGGWWASALAESSQFPATQPVDTQPAPMQPPIRKPAATQPINPATKSGDGSDRANEVVASRWIYAKGKEGVCFSSAFLVDVDRETRTKVSRDMAALQLSSDDIFNFPFAVMTGEGAFELSDVERKQLKTFLQRGGFLLASAGCSRAPWAESFEREIAAIFPDAKLKPLPMDHPIFTTGIYKIDRLVSKRPGAEPVIQGLWLGDRLAMIYSPMGLNDTPSVGGGCCCCGSNEIRNARLVNANALVYALTH